MHSYTQRNNTIHSHSSMTQHSHTAHLHSALTDTAHSHNALIQSSVAGPPEIKDKSQTSLDFIITSCNALLLRNHVTHDEKAVHIIIVRCNTVKAFNNMVQSPVQPVHSATQHRAQCIHATIQLQNLCNLTHRLKAERNEKIRTVL